MLIAASTEAAFTAQFSKNFIWVLLMIGLVLLQYVLTIYLVTMRARIAAFKGDFMKQFNEEHVKAFPHCQRAP